MRPEQARAGAAVAVLLLAALLAGCTPSIAERFGPDTLPRLDATRFVMSDGAPLPYRRWVPNGSTEAVVVALHGFNDYSNAYSELGPKLAERGLAVYAYDQRGFGEAPFRGDWAGSARLVSDLATVAGLLAERHPGLPLYGLGESMGGAVLMVALAGDPPAPLDGAVLSAPAVWGRSTMSAFDRAMLTLAAHLVPRIRVRPQTLPAPPSDNIDMLRALGRDPLIIKETRIEAAYGLTTLMDEALEAAGRIRKPLLVLYGEKDGIVPKDPTCRMLRNLPDGRDRRWRLALYADGYHLLFRDLNGGAVGADIAAWLSDPSAALPSGTERIPVAGVVPLPDFCAPES